MLYVEKSKLFEFVNTSKHKAAIIQRRDQAHPRHVVAWIEPQSLSKRYLRCLVVSCVEQGIAVGRMCHGILRILFQSLGRSSHRLSRTPQSLQSDGSNIAAVTVFRIDRQPLISGIQRVLVPLTREVGASENGKGGLERSRLQPPPSFG